MSPRLTHKRLLEVLHYDLDTGGFTWRVRPSKNVRVRAAAGCATSTGYVLIGVDKEDFFAHRLAYFYVMGEWPPHFMDHVNGLRSDNRWGNIRQATQQENMQNMKFGTKAILPGVSPSTNGRAFRANITSRGKRLCLGTFATPELAHAAYIQAKRIYHPRSGL